MCTEYARGGAREGVGFLTHLAGVHPSLGLQPTPRLSWQAVQDFWPRASLGLLRYDMSRTHSIMRVATTACPTGGSEVREQMIALEQWSRDLWAAKFIQKTWGRKARARGALKRRSSGWRPPLLTEPPGEGVEAPTSAPKLNSRASVSSAVSSLRYQRRAVEAGPF